jgi:hypothetical protein
MSKEVRFTATDEEYEKITSYVAKKRRWKKVSHFLRDACFQAIDRNPSGRHDNGQSRRGADRTEPPDGQNRAGT